MCCSCGCGLALAMAEAEERARCASAACPPSGSDQPGNQELRAMPAPSVRGWESLKVALRQIVGGTRGRDVPNIASAA